MNHLNISTLLVKHLFISQRRKFAMFFCFYLVLQFSFLIQYILCHAIVYDIIIFRYPISLQWKTANDVQINWYTFFADLKNNPRIWPIVLNQKLTHKTTLTYLMYYKWKSVHRYKICCIWIISIYRLINLLFESWICTLIMVTIILYIIELYSTLAHCCNTLDVSQMHV